MRASEQQWCCVPASPEPVVLDIIRHDKSNLDLRTQVRISTSVKQSVVFE